MPTLLVNYNKIKTKISIRWLKTYREFDVWYSCEYYWLTDVLLGYNASKEEDDDKPKEKLPLQVRIKSTVFKNRKEALEEILELYKSTEDTNDIVFSEYTSLFPKFVSDSNPACLEKGV